VAGLLITFTADHSAAFGLLVLGGLGLASALALALGAWSLQHGEPTRTLGFGLAIIAALAGSAALLSTGAGLPLLLLIAGGYALLSGAFEFIWGLRHRGSPATGGQHQGSHPLSRDAMTAGAATVVFALVLALVSDPVSAVGFLGAWAVVLAVYLVIAGLSTRWSAHPKESPAS
jgi:hypothetical protein